VREKKGTMVTASNGSQTVTRNSSHFKVIPKPSAQSQENDIRPQEYSKTHLTPKKRVCRDDPNGMSNLPLDFLTMYKSSMADKLKQGTFLIHLFILKKLKFTRLLFSKRDLG